MTESQLRSLPLRDLLALIQTQITYGLSLPLCSEPASSQNPQLSNDNQFVHEHPGILCLIGDFAIFARFPDQRREEPDSSPPLFGLNGEVWKGNPFTSPLHPNDV